MFPDLTRDDVFTLETKRLWLRWPRGGDVAAIRRIASRAEVADMTAAIPHPYPVDGAENFVLAARAANAEGREMALAITLKTTREAIGLVSASIEDGGAEIGFVLAPAHWGKGYATETAHAVIDAVFALTHFGEVSTNVRLENAASGRVLEKCGFSDVGLVEMDLPERGGRVSCRRYRLTRLAWGALRNRRIPAMTQQPAGAPGAGGGSAAYSAWA